MERELAKLIALTAFRSSAEINNLVPILKEQCSDADYRSFAMAIASASTEIGQQLLNKVYSLYPDIKGELEARVKKYGRAF